MIITAIVIVTIIVIIETIGFMGFRAKGLVRVLLACTGVGKKAEQGISSVETPGVSGFGVLNFEGLNP